MSSTPQAAVSEFLGGWQRHDWPAMITAAQPSWLGHVIDPLGHLSKWFGFKTLIEWGIDDDARLSSHVRQITVTIEYETGARRYRHKLRLMVIDETQGGTNGGQSWGVNPVSALREFDFADA
jgi:hypothetical protein